MECVEIRIHRSTFADTLQSMREWLDHHKSALTQFRSSLYARDLVIIHAEFEYPNEAAAFSERFNIHIRRRRPQASTLASG
jgi:hypothetical protein